MKFFTAILTMTLSLVIILTAGVNEQIQLSESFENGVPPSGWKTINNGFILDNWEASGWKAHSGQKSAFAEAYYATLDHWLVTPAIDLSSFSHAYLYFYEDEDNWSNGGSHHYIKVSTTSQTNTSSFTTVLDMTPSNHTIDGIHGNVVQVDLSAYVGNSTVYVAFHIQGDDNWYIDDVSVTGSQAHDVRAISVDMNSHYTANSSVTPGGVVSNVGDNAESFDVDFGYYNWDGSLTVLDTKTVSNLAAGASASITFNAFTIGDYERKFFIQTKLAGDNDPSNDIASKFVNTFSDNKSMVVVEEGTGTWCQYCPGAARALDSLYKAHHGSVAVIANHNGDDFTTTESDYRNDYYGINGFPTSVFGGTHRKVGGAGCDSDWSGLYNSYESLYNTVLGENTGLEIVNLSYVENGATITATTRTRYLTSSYNTAYRMFFVLIESHIAYSWQNCMDSLQHVMRKMYPDSLGQIFYDGSTAPTAGMEVEHQVDFTIPSGVVQDNCHLIAFVQEPTTKEIFTAAIVPLDGSVSALPGDHTAGTPTQFELLQNFPNPFNPVTTIRFNVPKKSEVTLTVYDAAGKKVRTLVNRFLNAGQHAVRFDGSDLASGVYFYRLSANNFSQTNKMLLIK